MLSSLNLESLLSEALSRHLTVVHQLDTQRQRLEEIAGRITKALLNGNIVGADRGNQDFGAGEYTGKEGQPIR